MIIGLMKDRKRDENRVALRPDQAASLIAEGHEVLVERNAGAASGYFDDLYQAAGARVTDRDEVLARGELLLRIKAPLFEEYRDFRRGQTLFCYLHFDENFPPERIMALTASGVTGVAYEWVEEQGRYPLLEPMSRLTGYLFAQIATELCLRYKGKLCGSFEPGLGDAGTLLLIGAGTIGQSVISYCLHNRIRLLVVDKHPETLEARLTRRFGAGFAERFAAADVAVRLFDTACPQEAVAWIARHLPRVDILINSAVRRSDLPASRLKYLVTDAMTATMAPGSVVCDATACDQDLLETCVSHETLYEHTLIHGVVHYNCDHLPSYAGRTATDLLTAATFPYIRELANRGSVEAVTRSSALQRAVCCHAGRLTHAYSAIKKGLNHSNIMDII